MSGPVTEQDVPPTPGADDAPSLVLELLESHEATVGAFRVRRALPRRARRTVGAWCFLDHMGPAEVTEEHGLDVGPHPHIGLHTVTWLLEGEALHRDSLGSEQLIRPGQLNLMTAGHGVSHAEEATGRYRGRLQGVQLWVAQPEATRHGEPAFEHHAELPQVELGDAVATVLLGELAGARSPARCDTVLVGADLDLRPGAAQLPLEPAHEHALVVVEGRVLLGDTVVEPGRLAFLGTGRGELAIRTDERSRVLLVGGEPFPDPVLMWWNYVARSREEIIEAHRSWSAADDRFGTVASKLPRFDVGPPPWPEAR